MKKTRLSDIFNADSVRNKKRILDRFEINKKEKRLFLDAIEEIENNEGGSGDKVVLEEKDCNFYDYDGTLLYSYTKEEALALTELPPLPTQHGLICQEWNWDLEDIINNNGICDVGATYITDDSKTRLYIDILIPMEIELCFQSSKSNGVIIDFGDGIIETINSTGINYYKHTYNKAGKYIINFDILDGNNFCFGNNSTNYGLFKIGTNNLQKEVSISSILYKVEIGKNITKFGTNAFMYCPNLKYITIPNNISTFDSNAFAYCYNFRNVVLPKSIIKINSSCFSTCKCLKLVSLSNNITDIDYEVFDNTVMLNKIKLPNNIINIGRNCFAYSNINFIELKIEAISRSILVNSYSLKKVILYNTTSIDEYAFSNSPTLGVYDCSNLKHIPSISSNSINNSSGYLFKIIVPDNLYEEWINATNWSNLADHIIKVSEYKATQQ